LSDALPNLLLDKIGLDTILHRVRFPPNFITLKRETDRLLDRFRRTICALSSAATLRADSYTSTVAVLASSHSLTCESSPCCIGYYAGSNHIPQHDPTACRS
jgi:hypothetical protein